MTEQEKDQAAPQSTRDKATAARRAHILEAALMCFLEAGYHQTGMREISKRANVSLGNLYNHFGGKHAILTGIAELERAEMTPFVKGLSSTRPAPKVLDTFLSRYGKYLAQSDNVILAAEITTEAIRKPDIAAMFVENRAVMAGALAQVLQRGVDQGTMRLPTEADPCAHLILDMLEACAYRVLVEEEAFKHTLKPLRAAVMAMVGAS